MYFSIYLFLIFLPQSILMLLVNFCRAKQFCFHQSTNRYVHINLNNCTVIWNMMHVFGFFSKITRYLRHVQNFAFYMKCSCIILFVQYVFTILLFRQAPINVKHKSDWVMLPWWFLQSYCQTVNENTKLFSKTFGCRTFKKLKGCPYLDYWTIPLCIIV